MVGISEQMVLYEEEAPFAFIPVVPLFILKGDGWERFNNGNIAGDFCYRIPGLASFYSEFLIDDVQSPASLFDDHWGNKWAWMAGIHVNRNIASSSVGIIAEFSRIEPWVYSHYLPGTAQSANAGYPLGNQAGPNSMTTILKAYMRQEGRWYAGIECKRGWKGTGLGSSLDDPSEPDPPPKKNFLEGAGPASLELAAVASYRLGFVGFSASASLLDDPSLIGRIHLFR
jgi:hypothetical protein